MPAWLGARLRALVGPLRGAAPVRRLFGRPGFGRAAVGAGARCARASASRCAPCTSIIGCSRSRRDWAPARARRRARCACRARSLSVRSSARAASRSRRRRARHATARWRQRSAPDELLLTAHHQDDQLETVLLALLRGSGVRGLAAMSAGERHGRDTLLLRPLLPVTRAQLEHYARERALDWSEDPSNADQRFDRNYLRRAVLPLLRQRWPAAAATVSRSAAHLAEARRLLEQLASALAARCARRRCAARERAAAPGAAAAAQRAASAGSPSAACAAPDHRRLREIAGPMLAAARRCAAAGQLARRRAAPPRRSAVRTAAPGAGAAACGDRALGLARATAGSRWRRRRARAGARPPRRRAAAGAAARCCGVRFRRGGERLQGAAGARGAQGSAASAGSCALGARRGAADLHAGSASSRSPICGSTAAYRARGRPARPTAAASAGAGAIGERMIAIETAAPDLLG